MTVTRDQAQMLATLAAASRPNGARRWDYAGIMATLAQRHDRALPDVILELITAAANADCETPGGIDKFGRTPAAVKTHTPERMDPANRCGVCSKSRDRCPRERVADDDHAFEAPHARPVIDVKRTVAALKDELAPTAPSPPPTGLDALTQRRPELVVAAAENVAALNPGLRASDERSDG